MNWKRTAFGAACLITAAWMQRWTYAREADDRVLVAAELARSGPAISAEAIGDGRRELYIALLSCGLFPRDNERILLARHGFTSVVCDDASGVTRTQIAEAPFLAGLLDP